MWRFAVSLVTADAAEDVVQDSLERAWRKRANFDQSRGTPTAWLLAIVADQARRRWRKQVTARPDLYVSEIWEDAPDAGNVDVQRAVDRLPKRQRSAVVLFYYVDLSIAEVSDLMGCSAGTIKSTLHDARHRLSELLGANYA
jgi:RNA polymerase sigma factor (sigma-70 family)